MRQMIKKVFVFLCLFFSFSVSALASDVEVLVAQGQQAYTQGEYKQAAILFNKAILQQPDRSDIFLQSAKALVELGDYSQALNDLDESIRLNPAGLEGYCIRSYLLMITGEQQKAVFDISKLMDVYPENVLLYYVRAFLYEQTGEFDKAIVDYTEALRLNKKTNKSASSVELLLFAEFSETPAFDKAGAALYYCRAMAQSKNGNFIEAKKDFKKAAKLNSQLLDDLPEGIVS